MRVLIIEDEIIAAEKLEQMLIDIDPKINIVAKIGSIKESVKWLFQNSVDLIFLDIQLSDGISFSIFEQVNINTPIIITTAFDQFAIKAFQYNSISYLLKPIRKSELTDSINKYSNLKSAFKIDFDELLAQIQGNNSYLKKRFMIQIGDKIKKIDVVEIAYFYAMEKGCFLRTFDNKNLPIDCTLDKLENIVDPSIFFRINRKFLINIDSIVNMFSWSRGRIKLELNPKSDFEDDIIVSIDRSVNFKRWLNS